MATNRLIEKEHVATYAAVLLNGAREAGGRDRVFAIRNELDAVARALRSSADAVDALSDATKAPQERNETARRLFAECDPFLIDALAVMAERCEVDRLTRVRASYEEQLQSTLGVTVVEVTTAVALDDALRDKITAKLAADFGTDIVLNEHVDASILGGIIMSANGRRIDASVTSQLDHARNVLTQTTDGGERS